MKLLQNFYTMFFRHSIVLTPRIHSTVKYSQRGKVLTSNVSTQLTRSLYVRKNRNDNRQGI